MTRIATMIGRMMGVLWMTKVTEQTDIRMVFVLLAWDPKKAELGLHLLSGSFFIRDHPF